MDKNPQKSLSTTVIVVAVAVVLVIIGVVGWRYLNRSSKLPPPPTWLNKPPM